MYIVSNNASVLFVGLLRSQVRDFLVSEKLKYEELYRNNLYVNQNYYNSVENYVGTNMYHYKVYQVGSHMSLKGAFAYSPSARGYTLQDGTDLTSNYLSVSQVAYNGNLKVFATVTKTGLKSTGMEVIVDPQLTGTSIRPVAEYESLVGTFARVKATTMVNETYGWATLFLSPDSLSNFRVETQQLNGNVLTLY